MPTRPAPKRPIYLSPSAFMLWRDCPYKYWLKYISGWKFPDQQGIPAAVGSAFDLFVKRWIAAKINISSEHKLQPEVLLENIQCPDEQKEEILRVGKNLSDFYQKLGLADRLMRENPVDLELEGYITLPNGVTILGKPDGCFEKDGEFIPFDFKVRGYGSKSAYSPTQGYRYYITNTGITKEAHAKAGIPMEKLNESWAIQLAMYYWILNGRCVVDRPIPAAIEEVVFNSTGFVFSSIRTTISPSFLQWLLDELKNCWDNCIYPPTPQPNNWRCNKYNMRCQCASRCGAYNEWQNNIFTQGQPVQLPVDG